MSPLRFIVCGSAGAGTSTLVSRLIAGGLQMTGDERRAPEGEAGIVSSPHESRFSTANRLFAVTDSSADESPTRSVARAAFNAPLAVVVVAAAAGISAETQRYSRLLALFGVRHLVLAVNKMDLIGWDGAQFEAIAARYRVFAEKLGMTGVTAIPVSAATGANITAEAAEMPQYRGPTLLTHLDTVAIDTPRGTAEPPSDQFEARLLWLNEHPLVAGRRYVVRIHTQEAAGSVSAIKYQLDPESGAHLAARRLCENEIGVVNLSLERPLPFTAYERNPALGTLELIDLETHEIAGAGMIDFALRRAANLHWQQLSVDKQARSRLKHHPPRCIWLTGLSGSGKSTIANLLEKQLHSEGLHTCLLDGDNVRHGLNRDLGFTEADRVENLRRIAEVAKLMVEAGLIVIVSFISPFRAERGFARSLFAEGEFIEVYIDTPLEECERRDPKGLYAKARAGRLANFTGIDSPYEHPENPEVGLKTTGRSPVECAEALRAALRRLQEPGTAA